MAPLATIAPIELIGIDIKGRPFVIGTRSRVSMIVRDVRTGMTPEQIAAAYGHLSLAQVHAALSHYYQHQEDVDADIASEDQDAVRSRAEAIASGRQLTREQLIARQATRTRGVE